MSRSALALEPVHWNFASVKKPCLISTSIMRPLRWHVLICLAVWQCLGVYAEEFHLNNGDVLRGEPVSFNDDGLVVRLDIGGHSPRISWSKLTQDTLKDLAKNPQAARFVEPFIDEPPVPKEKEKKKDLTIRPVPRVERIEKPNFFASFVTPAGLAVFLVLYLANIYAAYEIARFRHRQPMLVCGTSLVLPVIAPAIFMFAPTGTEPAAEAEAVTEPAVAAQAAGKATTGSLPKAPAMAPGLSIAQGGEKPGGGAAQTPQTYKRGEFTFNRRFMETKFASFFRIVQSEADKDLVLVVRTVKEEHIAKRISRISSTEMHLQLVRGVEVSVPFADIGEILVRHKEGKA
jgi:hypothetical protein